MRILFLSDNFPPEVNAPATRTYENCIKWINMGYKVTVITCFPNFPFGKVYSGYKNKLFKKENINGIEVIRVWSYITKNEGFVKRIIDYSSYGLSSFIFGLFIKTDYIIATSPHFFSPISASMLSLFKNKPWVFEVRDLWPDSISAVGSMNKSSFLFKILKKIESFLYSHATKIIVVTDSFKAEILTQHKISPSKIGVFKNGIVKSNIKIKNHSQLKLLRDSLGLTNKIVFSYIGTHGLAHGLKFILKTISKIPNKNFHFLFVGDGAEKKKLLEYSKKLKNNNFTFLDSVSKEKVFSFIEISNYSIINLKKSNDFKNVIPSKIFENVALYKPVLLGVEGESKKLIEKYNVGIAYEPENSKSFLKAISEVQNLNKKLFKKNCDKMINDFDRNKIAEELIKFIIKC